MITRVVCGEARFQYALELLWSFQLDLLGQLLNELKAIYLCITQKNLQLVQKDITVKMQALCVTWTSGRFCMLLFFSLRNGVQQQTE